MDDATFEDRIERARREIDGLPDERQARLRELLEQTERGHAQIEGDVQNLAVLVADWKTRVRDLARDLEATKRELNKLSS